MNFTYTSASSYGFLKTALTLQPTLAAQNFSGYMYPSATHFYAELIIHNSANLTSANATLAPLFDFAASEIAQGHPMQIQALPYALTDYMQLFQGDPNTVSEGGVAASSVLGSRLAPITAFKEGQQLEKMITFLQDWQGVSVLHLGKSFLVTSFSTNSAGSCGRSSQ